MACSDLSRFPDHEARLQGGWPYGPVHGLGTRPQRQEPVSKVESNIRLSIIPHSLGGWVA